MELVVKPAVPDPKVHFCDRTKNFSHEEVLLNLTPPLRSFLRHGSL